MSPVTVLGKKSYLIKKELSLTTFLAIRSAATIVKRCYLIRLRLLVYQPGRHT
jgi:hypothetical protein